MTLQQAAIAWQVYQISGSPLQLGLLGLVRFFPALGMSLVGGAVADTYDRRRIVMVGYFVPVLCSGALAISTLTGTVNLPLIYTLVLVLALAAAFEGPAREALLPQLVTKESLPNALTVRSTIQQLAFVSGPVIAGLAIDEVGLAGTYGVHMAFNSAAVLILCFVRTLHGQDRRGSVSLAAIKEGLHFVRRQRVLLGVMTVDLFAVIFAGAQALLPVYAEDILKVGPRGYGLLTSAQAAGSFTMALVLMALPPVQRTGRALLFAAAAFGLTTLVFGLSRSFLLSLCALALTGAVDQVSVVMRQTTIQLATPDELRGRVNSVSQVFIGASNQIGAVESGLVAALTNATFAVVSGGVGCLAVVAGAAAWFPELWRHRILRPGTPPSAEVAAAAPSSGLHVHLVSGGRMAESSPDSDG